MKEKTEIEDKIEDAIYRNIYTDLDGGLYGENEAINELTALFNTQNQKLKPKQPIVITDVIDLAVAFVKQEKKKAVSDRLTELWKKINQYDPDSVDKNDLREFFTEAEMK